ncbi:MAG: hypothetical protein PF630_11055, partial [Gammaproteobacteria bacterium]|nr:hypothetical protein [Gammaproteobacteria bacterium]
MKSRLNYSYVVSTLHALLLAVLIGLSGCAAVPKTPIASVSIRSDILNEQNCAYAFRRINKWIDFMADYHRTPFQLKTSPGLDIFDTSLIEKWEIPKYGFNGQWWIYTNNKDFAELSPHIMNYDLMGDIYIHGCDNAGIQPDPLMAANYYEFAAIGHVAQSQRKLGRMLFEGDGIQVNESMGIKWLTSAALEGDIEARTYLNSLKINIPV